MFYMNPSQLFTGYEHNVTRTSAFFGDLDEPKNEFGNGRDARIEHYSSRPWMT